ncbi:EI24 domain-containing protein [Microbacterium sp. P04]|uniref:EI24 domain-containing protein n=1 Tax=Microbacterium sp. P04 TaxID=3366947 RepID=UPI003746EC20
MREFGAGVGLLLRGFGMWRRIPRAMALGLLPAVLVALVFAGALVGWGFLVPGIADAVTPFADGWTPFWAQAVRLIIGLATFGAGMLLAAVSFTAVTLAVGDPFYERLWRAVERETTGGAPGSDGGFWQAVGDSIRLVLKGIAAAALAWLIGLIPFVGGVAGLVVGVSLTGWLLAEELSSRALVARGISARRRSALLRGSRARVIGFGVATQLCFLVPLGAVIVMPAAVAGSTLLAQSLVRKVEPAPLSPSS